MSASFCGPRPAALSRPGSRSSGTLLGLFALAVAASLVSWPSSPNSLARAQSPTAAPTFQATADASLQAAIRAARYRVEPAADRPGTFRAASPAQRLHVEFDRQVVRLAAAERSPQWHLGLRLESLGRGSRVEPVRAAGVTANGDRVEYRHRTEAGAELTEWYVNEPRGLEQGFTLERDLLPAGGTAPLQLALSLSGDLAAASAADGQSVTLQDDAGGKVLRCDHLKAWDRTGRELPSRMTTVASASGDERLTLEINDTAAVYPVTIDPLWTYQAKLTASNGVAGDQFGYSVAINGDTAVVGAPAVDRPGLSEVGATYVFVRSGGAWSQQALLTDPNGGELAHFGTAVAIDGDTVVVGAPAVSISSSVTPSSVSIYERSGTTWNRTARFVGGRFDALGSSAAVRGDRIVVGARFDNIGGAAYIYERSGGSWSQAARLEGDAQSGWFGASVAITSYGTILVGSPMADAPTTKAGTVYLFAYLEDYGFWGPLWHLVASDFRAGAHFGITLDTDEGNTVAVGADVAQLVPGDPNHGAVYVLTLDPGFNFDSLTEPVLAEEKVVAADSTSFGRALSLSGDNLVVSGSSDDDGRGAVYFFNRSGGSWTEREKITAPDAAIDDSFGHSVALSGQDLLVGSSQDDDLGADSGSAYLFAAGQPSSISTIGNQETWEDQPTAWAPFMVSDPDTPVQNLITYGTSSVPGFVQGFNFTGTGTDRAVQIVPAPDVNGSATVSVCVTDGTSTAATTFTLTVHAVNDAPHLVPGGDQEVFKNAGPQTASPWATGTTPGPADEAGQSLTFQVIGNTNPSLFAEAPAVSPDGTLTYTPAPDTLGTAVITLVLKDDGGTAHGGSDTSAPRTFRITVWDPVQPAPTSLTATVISENRVDLHWVDPTDQLTVFAIERKAPGEADFTFLQDVGANVTSYQDTTVSPHAEPYVYRVFSVVPGLVSSPASNEATALVPLPAPTGLAALAVSATDKVLYWYDHSGSETGYEVERKLAGGSYQLVAVLPADSQSYLDEELTPEATYVYRVRAFASSLSSAWSNEAQSGGTPPTAPSGLTAIQAGPNEVRLNWQDKSSDETDFELRRKTGTAGAAGSYARIATLPAGTTAYLDNGRTPGPTYTYQVVAVNAAGPSSPSAPASATLTVDTVKPTLTLNGTRPGPPVQIDIAVQDTGSGLAEIQVITSDNCTISFAPFTPGTTAPVLVTATKVNPSASARVVLRARDLAGNWQDGDPVITELVIGKKQTKVAKSFSGLPVAESWLRVENGTPGLKKLVVTVNQTKPLNLPLKDGQTREQDLASRMQPGDTNTVKLVGHGKPGSRALVILAEPPSAGSAAKVRIQRVAPGGPAVNLEWHR